MRIENLTVTIAVRSDETVSVVRQKNTAVVRVSQVKIF